MPYVKGRNQYVAVKRELTRLTAETTGFAAFIPWMTYTLVEKLKAFKDESAIGTVGKLQNQYIENQWAEGDITGLLDTDNILYALYHTFGSGTPTTALGATTWAFSVLNSNILPTFTAQTQRGDESYRRVRGCAVKSLKISIKEAGEAMYTLVLVGLDEATGTAVTTTYTKQAKVILGKNWSLGYATTLAGLSSATNVAKVKTLDFEFMTGVTPKYYIGSVNPLDVPADGRACKITADVHLDATNSLLSQYEAGAKLAFRLNGVGANLPIIGTSALKPTLTIDVPPSQINVNYKIPKDDYISFGLEVEIEQPELVIATLINAITTY